MTLAWCAAPAAAHDKTAVVVLKNGDRSTGEIKGVAQEALELDTDAAGTIKLEWTHVASLSSTFTYELEVTTGERYFGSFEASDETGELLIVGGDGKLTRQIINNFNLGITLLDSYDTRPPTVEAKTNDMSLSLSVGYSY